MNRRIIGGHAYINVGVGWVTVCNTLSLNYCKCFVYLSIAQPSLFISARLKYSRHSQVPKKLEEEGRNNRICPILQIAIFMTKRREDVPTPSNKR